METQQERQSRRVKKKSLQRIRLLMHRTAPTATRWEATRRTLDQANRTASPKPMVETKLDASQRLIAPKALLVGDRLKLAAVRKVAGRKSSSHLLDNNKRMGLAEMAGDAKVVAKALVGIATMDGMSAMLTVVVVVADMNKTIAEAADMNTTVGVVEEEIGMTIASEMTVVAAADDVALREKIIEEVSDGKIEGMNGEIGEMAAAAAEGETRGVRTVCATGNR